MTVQRLSSPLLDNRVSGLRLPRKKLLICLHFVLGKNYKKQLDVIFVDKKTMRQLNRDFHNADVVTDVLAFPYEENFLGEVFVCPEVARKQALKRSLSFTSELVLYAVHGTLHLLGYDDHSKVEAKKMRKKEVQALAQAGLLTDRMETMNV